MAACGATNPDLPKSTKSHLMKVLREAGIVRNVPNGRQRTISLRKDELDAKFPGLLDSVLGGQSAASAASTSSRVIPSR
jgi:DNA-binding transcriptional ArsR family regulator